MSPPERVPEWLIHWRAGYESGLSQAREIYPIVGWGSLLLGFGLGCWYAG